MTATILRGDAEHLPLFCVTTWDAELQRWTPQTGINGGPLNPSQLRDALRKLRRMGYDIYCGAPSVRVERVAW